MKKIILLSFLLLSILNQYAQTITLTFTAKNAANQNTIALDSVYVQNLSIGCDTMIFGSAPSLEIPIIVGVAENEPNQTLSLSPNVPNPFNGSTIVDVYLPIKGPLWLQLSDNLGRQISEYKNNLRAGRHRFQIHAGKPGLLFLNVLNDKNVKTVKLLNTSSYAGENSISMVESIPEDFKTSLQTSSNGFEYYLGDALDYTAMASGYGNKTIQDSPTANTTYTFYMTQTANPPTVITTVVTSITQTTATSGGNVTSDGGSPVLSRGVCWSTSSNPTTANSYTVDGSGPGIFVSSLAGLLPGTLYYLRSYATNAEGTAYGEEVQFVTLQNTALPTVTTTAVTSITQTTATSGGNVIADGGAIVTARGICWGTAPNPTTANSYTVDGVGLGLFVSYLTGLNPNTLYYARAYATNSTGTAYGNETAFTTGQTTTPPTVTTTAITNIAQTTATSGGTVTADGGATVTVRGVCWGTTPNPVATGSHTIDGSGTGTFVSNITGLTGGTLYYVRAYATNSVGTSYGNELTFTTLTLPTVTTNTVTNLTQTTATGGGNVTSDGGATVTARGVCWSTTTNPIATGNHTTDGIGVGTFVSNITGLTGGTLYYVRAYATNSVGTSYGNEISFITLNLPTVTTSAISNIAQTTATSGGNVTSDGGAAVTARGVCWSTTPNPLATGLHTTDGSGTGTFVSNITGLTANTLYYVRAYATNSVGTSYGNEVSFTTLTTGFTCGTSSVIINHVTGAVAPVNKTVTYGTVTNIPGEPTKCWITQNLGSDHQATAVSDATEASAGWYWQFNRKQGYKHDGTTRTPATTWITSINENSDWLPANDPCTLEFGSGWRIPTKIEWTNVYASGIWVTWAGPWNSGLKLHAAGFLNLSAGSLSNRGSYGYFWSSVQYAATDGWDLNFYSGGSSVGTLNKANGFSVRCLRDGGGQVPTLTTNTITNITQTTANSGGNVTSDGGAAVTARGVCWSTTPNPLATGLHTTDGSGTGTFVSNITGLTANTLYYVRAYATNSVGTSYGNEVSFTTQTTGFTCGTSSVIINHVIGAVAPVNKTVTYGTVTNIPGEPTKCWITQNLGSDHQATAVSDATEASAGWYWQFNRKQGYKHDGTTRTPATTWITSINENSDWLPANDPCTLEFGSGWRIPTKIEWTNVYASGGWTNWNGPWNSGLKLHAAGYLYYSDGLLIFRGQDGLYWSSVQDVAAEGWFLHFMNVTSGVSPNLKAYGFSVRCLRNSAPLVTTLVITNITQTTAASGGNVTSDGGAAVTARGVCWGTTPNPLATGLHTTDGSGTGTFVSNITGLTANTLYYVRAYATNSIGTSYGNEVSFTTAFNCGTLSLIINHVAGAVAPVNKSVIYGTVNNIPGEPGRCWITQNLGSDHQATAVSDATEASAGWYWQFNRKQGYKHDGTTRTPATTWITSISENSDWLPANDPCALELGSVWRLPTTSEWDNVDNAGGWTNWNGPWNSGLKLHAAGYLYESDGSLSHRGSYGLYWSSSRVQYNATYGWYLSFVSGGSNMDTGNKAYGFSVRCLRD